MMGLVAPLGVDIRLIENTIADYLKQFNYQLNTIVLSSLILKVDGLETKLLEQPEEKRIDSYMTAGNEAREKAKRGDFIAALAICNIHEQRKNDENKNVAIARAPDHQIETAPQEPREIVPGCERYALRHALLCIRDVILDHFGDLERVLVADAEYAHPDGGLPGESGRLIRLGETVHNPRHISKEQTCSVGTIQ